MSKYVPTTDEVRDVWVHECAPAYAEAEREFDAWIALVRADVWDACATAIGDGLGASDAIQLNPYRNGG